MIREVDGRWWFCRPRCGKKLYPLQAGAVCRGVLAQCRERGCDWAGEIVVEWEPEKMRSILPA